VLTLLKICGLESTLHRFFFPLGCWGVWLCATFPGRESLPVMNRLLEILMGPFRNVYITSQLTYYRQLLSLMMTAS
jgi:hypothetical protein